MAAQSQIGVSIELGFNVGLWPESQARYESALGAVEAMGDVPPGATCTLHEQPQIIAVRTLGITTELPLQELRDLSGDSFPQIGAVDVTFGAALSRIFMSRDQDQHHGNVHMPVYDGSASILEQRHSVLTATSEMENRKPTKEVSRIQVGGEVDSEILYVRSSIPPRTPGGEEQELESDPVSEYLTRASETIRRAIGEKALLQGVANPWLRLILPGKEEIFIIGD